MSFFKDGTEITWAKHQTVPDGSVSGRHPSCMSIIFVSLTAGEYVDIRFRQTSGSQDTVFQTSFGGFKIR